jgi:type IV secretory pathway VirB3-like protein
VACMQPIFIQQRQAGTFVSYICCSTLHCVARAAVYHNPNITVAPMHAAETAGRCVLRRRSKASSTPRVETYKSQQETSLSSFMSFMYGRHHGSSTFYIYNDICRHSEAIATYKFALLVAQAAPGNIEAASAPGRQEEQQITQCPSQRKQISQAVPHAVGAFLDSMCSRRVECLH